MEVRLMSNNKKSILNCYKIFSIYMLTIICLIFTVIFIILNIININNISKVNSNIIFNYKYKDYELNKIDGKIELMRTTEYIDDMTVIREKTNLKMLIFPTALNCNYVSYYSYLEEYYYDLDSIKYRAEIYLEAKFENDTYFKEEIDRLNNIEICNKKLVFVDDLFYCDSYISIYNDDSEYEYCLVNEKDKIIHYIYLNEVGINNFVFDDLFIPKKRIIDSSFPKNLIKINYYNMYMV